MSDLNLEASELSALYRKHEVSPVDALRDVLMRLETIAPRLNAFRLVDTDRALQQAHESEQRWVRKGPKSAIDGVPAALKDHLFLVKKQRGMRYAP